MQLRGGFPALWLGPNTTYHLHSYAIPCDPSLQLPIHALASGILVPCTLVIVTRRSHAALPATHARLVPGLQLKAGAPTAPRRSTLSRSCGAGVALCRCCTCCPTLQHQLRAAQQRRRAYSDPSPGARLIRPCAPGQARPGRIKKRWLLRFKGGKGDQ